MHVIIFDHPVVTGFVEQPGIHLSLCYCVGCTVAKMVSEALVFLLELCGRCNAVGQQLSQENLFIRLGLTGSLLTGMEKFDACFWWHDVTCATKPKADAPT